MTERGKSNKRILSYLNLIKMQILYVTPEARPYSKFGGLADVASELPKNLAERDIEVSVVTPRYEWIEGSGFEKVLETEVKMNEEKKIKISLSESEDIPYYLIGGENLFSAEDISVGADGRVEDFAYFSKGVIKLLKSMDSEPDVVHCNNWQTALVPAYLERLASEKDFGLEDVKTVFTVHSIEPQGKLSEMSLSDLGLTSSYSQLSENGVVNMMKAGLVYSDSVNTVSETYAREIQSPSPVHYHGLGAILRESVDLRGIPNSIDEDYWNPRDDNSLYVQYDSIEGKLKNKQNFVDKLGFSNNSNSPLVGVVSRLVRRKGVGLIADILPKLLTRENLNFVLLGTGSEKFEKFFRHVDEDFDDAEIFLRFDDSLARKIFAASDILLAPSLSEPFGLTPLIGLRYGTVSVVRKTGGLSENIVDYGERDQNGNGFVFSEPTSVALESGVKRAIQVWENGGDWENLVESVMNTDFSWDGSMREYIELYHSGA